MAEFGEDNYFEDGNNEGEQCSTIPKLKGIHSDLYKLFETEELIDGIVIMSDNLGFFRLDTPYEFGNFRIEAKVSARFKGLENWWAKFDQLLEIKIGRIHNHSLSILFAYTGAKNIPFGKILSLVKASMINAIEQLPEDSMARTEVNHSISRKIIFRNRRDFELAQVFMKKEMDFLLQKTNRVFKTAYVLYKFGQSLPCNEFAQEYSWLNIQKTTGIIFHYAKDFCMKNYLLWFIPSAISNVLGCKPTAIYHVGLQPGLGNTRHVIKSESCGTSTPTHVTWYTRIWQEIHRDPSGYFSRARLGNQFLSLYEELFTTSKEYSTKCSQSEETIRARIPEVIRNTSKLKANYSSRVEVVVFTAVKNIREDQFSEFLPKIAINIENWMRKKKYFSPNIFYPQPIVDFEAKISNWFYYFAGTIEDTCDKIVKLKSVKSKMCNDSVVEEKLDILPEIYAVYAVDYVLTMCYTGNVVCSTVWRNALGISTNFFLQKDLTSTWKFPTFEVIESEGRKRISLYTPIHVFANSFIYPITRSRVPSTFEKIYEIGKVLATRYEEGAMRFIYRNRLQKTQELVKVFSYAFVCICFQYSSIKDCTGPVTLLALMKDVKEAEVKKAQVLTVTEFMELMRLRPVQGQPWLDGRFFLYKKIAEKVELIAYSTFWSLMINEFQNLIFSQNCPIICKGDPSYPSPTKDLIIVPNFEETSARIERFNYIWTCAACLYIGRHFPNEKSIPGGGGLFHCFEGLNKRNKNLFVRGSFVEALGASILSYSDQNALLQCKIYNSLPKSAQTRLVKGRFIKGLFTVDENDTDVETTLDSDNQEESQPRTKKGRFKHGPSKTNPVSVDMDMTDEDVLQYLDKFRQSIGKKSPDDPKSLELDLTSEVCAYPNLFPVTLQEVLLCYQGSCWMDVTFLNSGLSFLKTKFSGNPDEDAVLCFNACMYTHPTKSKKPEWSTSFDTLTTVNNLTKRVFHNFLLLNHYVFTVVEISRKQESILLNTISFDSLHHTGAYTKRLEQGVHLLISLLQQRIRQLEQTTYSSTSPVFETRWTKMQLIQQDDAKSCGASCLKSAEIYLQEGESSSGMRHINQQEYERQLISEILKTSTVGNKILTHFNFNNERVHEHLITCAKQIQTIT